MRFSRPQQRRSARTHQRRFLGDCEPLTASGAAGLAGRAFLGFPVLGAGSDGGALGPRRGAPNTALQHLANTVTFCELPRERDRPRSSVQDERAAVVPSASTSLQPRTELLLVGAAILSAHVRFARTGGCVVVKTQCDFQGEEEM